MDYLDLGQTYDLNSFGVNLRPNKSYQLPTQDPVVDYNSNQFILKMQISAQSILWTVEVTSYGPVVVTTVSL